VCGWNALSVQQRAPRVELRIFSIGSPLSAIRCAIHFASRSRRNAHAFVPRCTWLLTARDAQRSCSNESSPCAAHQRRYVEHDRGARGVTARSGHRASEPRGDVGATCLQAGTMASASLPRGQRFGRGPKRNRGRAGIRPQSQVIFPALSNTSQPLTGPVGHGDVTLSRSGSAPSMRDVL
jgi:hypothetical protein